jgi:hypothetical protein
MRTSGTGVGVGVGEGSGVSVGSGVEVGMIVGVDVLSKGSEVRLQPMLPSRNMDKRMKSCFLTGCLILEDGKVVNALTNLCTHVKLWREKVGALSDEGVFWRREENENIRLES